MLCGPNEDDPNASAEFLRSLANWARERDVRVHAHVSETVRRQALFRARTGSSPIAFYRSIGLLDHLYAVHCTAIDESDAELLAEYDVPVILTPSSEALLGDGVTDIPTLRSAGVTLGLGTDGGAWSGSEDPFAEMRAAALLNRARHGPESLSGAELIEMATVGGARALGVERQRGSIVEGKNADLVVLDTCRPGLRPLLMDGPLANVRDVVTLTATGADVCEVLAGGTKLYRSDAPLLPGSELPEMQECARRVWLSVGGRWADSW